jgi:ABC-2 type transport system permease protein
MTATVFRIGWLALRRDPVALVLTVVLPIAFFSIFAVVFGGITTGAEQPIETRLVDEDATVESERLLELLRADPSLRVPEDEDVDSGEAAREAVATGRVPCAIVVRSGFAEAFPPTAGAPSRVDVLADTSHPMAARIARAAVQTAAVRLGLAGVGETRFSDGRLVRTVDVIGQPGRDPTVSYFAAGIGVLFLLFAVSGRAAILIEERESGVLARLLASGLGMTRLLLGRWLFLTALGTFQVTLMFVWGALVFGLELFTPRHLTGFALLTVVTAACAAAFGMVLAVSCRTRAQLAGVSAVVILIMSAVGGSMFPRFLMPPAMRAVGLATFNAWALDGYRKVFWYGLGPASLAPQLAVLAVACIVMLALARAIALGWERS